MRKEYRMSESQLERMLEAMKPTPYMVVGGHPPQSPQARANAAWDQLGKEMGFRSMTVRPVPGKGPEFFTAEPSEAEE